MTVLHDAEGVTSQNVDISQPEYGVAIEHQGRVYVWHPRAGQWREVSVVSSKPAASQRASNPPQPARQPSAATLEHAAADIDHAAKDIRQSQQEEGHHHAADPSPPVGHADHS